MNSRPSAIGYTGDICQPMVAGIIGEGDIRGDLFDLVRGRRHREPEEITFYKNAGGAHVDLMVARSFFERA